MRNQARDGLISQTPARMPRAIAAVPNAAQVCAAASAVVAAQAPSSARLDAAMRAFWDAGDAGDAEKAAQQVMATGASLEEIRARLKTGRPYTKQKTGRVELPSPW